MDKIQIHDIDFNKFINALDHCKDLLVRFGGHELAAGLTVMRCNIDEFRKRINDYAREKKFLKDNEANLSG